MKLEAQPRFWKDISSAPKSIKIEVRNFIDDIEHIALSEARASYDFKPMKTNAAFYRLHIEEYRLGCRYDRATDTLILMRLLQRGEIYRYFP